MLLYTLTLAVLLVGAVVSGLILEDVSAENSTSLDARIVGGRPTKIEKHPHQVSLEMNKYFSCGGSIIGQYWVLTAAHCVENQTPHGMDVRAGTTRKEIGGDVYSVSEIIIHPYYNRARLEYDVAVLKTERAINFSNWVKPISMIKNTPSVMSAVVTTGWGSLVEGGDSPQDLQEVVTYVSDWYYCYLKYGIVGIQVTETMLCARFIGGGGPCHGDSGGPLVYRGELCGVVSGAVKCGSAFFPSLYTDVAHVRNWISSVTGIK